jgi:hypothetical protein
MIVDPNDNQEDEEDEDEDGWKNKKPQTEEEDAMDLETTQQWLGYDTLVGGL